MRKNSSTSKLPRIAKGASSSPAVHVGILLDISGSMTENLRLQICEVLEKLSTETNYWDWISFRFAFLGKEVKPLMLFRDPTCAGKIFHPSSAGRWWKAFLAEYLSKQSDSVIFDLPLNNLKWQIEKFGEKMDKFIIFTDMGVVNRLSFVKKIPKLEVCIINVAGETKVQGMPEVEYGEFGRHVFIKGDLLAGFGSVRMKSTIIDELIKFLPVSCPTCNRPDPVEADEKIDVLLKRVETLEAARTQMGNELARVSKLRCDDAANLKIDLEGVRNNAKRLNDCINKLDDKQRNMNQDIQDLFDREPSESCADVRPSQSKDPLSIIDPRKQFMHPMLRMFTPRTPRPRELRAKLKHAEILYEQMNCSRDIPTTDEIWDFFKKLKQSEDIINLLIRQLNLNIEEVASSQNLDQYNARREAIMKAIKPLIKTEH